MALSSQNTFGKQKRKKYSISLEVVDGSQKVKKKSTKYMYPKKNCDTNKKLNLGMRYELFKLSSNLLFCILWLGVGSTWVMFAGLIQTYEFVCSWTFLRRKKIPKNKAAQKTDFNPKNIKCS